MQTIAKPHVLLLTELLHQAGIRRIVVSPGSRNAAINIALSRSGHFALHTVIDERTAAFVALGMASAGEPAALVCTSGTAVLNYAPAVAEAYYGRIPLVIISADRPAKYIDQRDSQTIRQPQALAALVRRSVDIAEEMDAAFAARLVSDALLAATGNIPGPVHINMQIGRPLTPLDEVPATHSAFIPRLFRPDTISSRHFGEFIHQIGACPKILIAIGSTGGLTVPPRVAKASNIAAVAEVNANVRGLEPVSASVFDRFFLSAAFAPAIVLSIGGALISDAMKAFLRRCGAPVVNVGFDDRLTDTFGTLSACVEMEPERFLEALAGVIPQSGDSSYRSLWEALPVANAPEAWSDCKAMDMISKAYHGGSVFLANGMVARYAQLMRWEASHIFAQRGVSGIDGCTSTAAGISLISDRTVLLLSGDMGAAYDIGALAIKGLRPNFKIAVFDNCGGDIFRHVATTEPFAAGDEADFIVAKPQLPLESLAEAYGFAYYSADSVEACAAALPSFLAEARKPAILHLKTDPDNNRKAYQHIYTKTKI